ncbi:hypothetical protein [Kingella oralis]|uniref:hypothetical protein n=1 Tax=Kingella oralis TaxID=505 RepID=UPI0034E3F62A
MKIIGVGRIAAIISAVHEPAAIGKRIFRLPQQSFSRFMMIGRLAQIILTHAASLCLTADWITCEACEFALHPSTPHKNKYLINGNIPNRCFNIHL